MKLRRVTAVLLACAMTLGLVACGSGGKEDGSREKEGKSDHKLTIWAWDESFNIKAANEAEKIYAKENPDMDVEIVTMAQDDIVAKLNTSLASGSYDGLPDIVLIEDYRTQAYLTAYQDEFADLSDIASPDDFAEFKTGINQIDGKMYGIPFDSGLAAVFYRTDLIEQAGYTKEAMNNLTWDEYIEIGKAVKEKTGKLMVTLNPDDLSEIRMMLQSAGVWYTDEEDKVNIADHKAMQAAVKTYKKLVDAGITKTISDWEQFVGAFHKGEVATVVAGCWISPSVMNAEEQSGKWAVAKLPRMAEIPESVNASSIGGAGWYVLKNVGNEKAAKEFLKETFATNTDLMNTLAAEINLVSTLKAARDAENYRKGVDFYGGQEIFKDFAEWANEVPTVNYGGKTYVIEDIIKEAVQEILGGADIDKTLKDYQGRIEAAVAQ